MTKFEPAPHHRRLRLRTKPGAKLPKADPRPTPLGHQQLEREFTQMLLDQGRICPSNSPVGAPMLFVPKPKKTPGEPTRWRCVIDYRRINEILEPGSYRLPAMDSLWYSMDSAAWITGGVAIKTPRRQSMVLHEGVSSAIRHSKELTRVGVRRCASQYFYG